jgi:hypothetical protein
MLFIGHKDLALAALQAASDLRISCRILENTIQDKEITRMPDAQGILIVKGAFGKTQKINGVQKVCFPAPILPNQTIYMFPKGEGFLFIAFKVCKMELF